MTENEAIETLTLSETEKKIFPMLTPVYEVAIKALEEVEQYRAIEKDLKERYHANVDIPLLMHHFIETVFEGEKHEGFCLLTNEDREAWEKYKAIGTPEELQKAEKEENILKFYYCDSEDSYLIGRRVGNFYYAHYLDGSWVFDMSRYLPWGIYINGREYPSEPREINFSEWLKGFVKKECGGTPEELQEMKKDFAEALSDWRQYRKIGTLEECRAAVEKQNETLTVDEAKTIAAKAICIGCGYLAGCKCNYNGGNCMVSKPMLESVSKSFDDWNRRTNDETD